MDRDKPLVTVLTLSYKSPDLKGSINSVLSQTYPKIQFIIVDDGTEDFDKEEIGKHIRAKQRENIVDLKIIKNIENLGTVKTANIGMSNASGEIIFNLAGDDQFSDDKVLEDWVKEFNETRAEIMTARRDVYDEWLEEKLYTDPSSREIEYIVNYDSKSLFEKIGSKNIIFGCSTAQTLKLYKEFGPYNEAYKLVDDHPYILKLVRENIKIHFFDRVVVKYRQGGISYSPNINEVYYKDADNILINEVLPYTDNPERAKREYKTWKKEMEWGHKAVGLRRKEKRYKNNKIKLFLVRAMYGLRYPSRVFKKIKNCTIKNKGS